MIDDAANTRTRRRVGRLLLAPLLVLGMLALAACDVPPAPPIAAPENSGSGRRVVYSVEQQRVWWVEADERVVRTYLVSGRANTPRPGHYRIYSRSRHTTSLNGKARMEFMLRFAHGRTAAIGFHSIPVDSRGRPLQSDAELGQYRSAGCIRQNYHDALGLWNWAPVGTAVVVVK